MLLVIDNFDSFTYNLVQYLGELGEKLKVFRNNQLTIKDILKLNPDSILLSPGPCTPDEAGITLDVIRYFFDKIPILGVCLGHQAICQAFGGKIVRANDPMHGKTSQVFHDGNTVFQEVPSPFTAVRYHSLVLEPASLPSCLEVTAWTAAGEVMGVRHKVFRVEGVQFHPESILTEHGKKILGNFLKLNSREELSVNEI